MACDKTDSELRNDGVHPELFHVSPEMLEAMREARESQVASQPSQQPRCSDEQSNFRPYDQEQRFFVEVSRRDFFDGAHPAHIIDRVVESLDLGEIYEDYSHEGNPAYHPMMMLKVLFYAYYIGVMSSRTIWDCVINRADFIYLAAGQVPNFRTINAFRLRHLSKLGSLFTQIVLLCTRLGMVGFEHLAIDGQKIQANASFTRSKNLSSLNKEYEKIKRGLEKVLEREVNEQTREKRDQRAAKLEKKLEQLDEFRKTLETLEDPEKRVNMTDSDAPTMTHKGGMARPSYNHQSAVDDRYGVTTAVRTSQHGDHGDDLFEITDAAKVNGGSGHAVVSADCAFCNYEMLERIEQRSESFYVPDRLFEKSQEDEKRKRRFGTEDFICDEHGEYHCPAGHPMRYVAVYSGPKGQPLARYKGTGCLECELKPRCTKAAFRDLNVDSREPYRRKMREKLQTDEGREIYMKRQAIVERGHGDDQHNRKWRQHHLRGLEKARAEFALIRIVSNIAKIIRFKPTEFLALQLT